MVLDNGRFCNEKYLRISFMAGPLTLSKVLTNIWELKSPDLLISVIGDCEAESLPQVDAIIQTALTTSN